MAAQAIAIDRREHPREGVIGQLEDISYAALRRYGVIGGAKTRQVDSTSQTPAGIR
jgi:hypothetical protein